MEDDRWGGDAFDALYRDSFGPVAHAVAWIVGDREVAREIAHDAFVAALVHWKKVSRYDNPGAWVRRVAIRIAVRSARRNARVERFEPAPGDEGDPTELLAVRDAVAALPGRQRAVIVLHYFFDLPVSEVARTLGTSDGTVKTHLHRARQSMAAMLGEDDA